MKFCCRWCCCRWCRCRWCSCVVPLSCIITITGPVASEKQNNQRTTWSAAADADHPASVGLVDTLFGQVFVLRTWTWTTSLRRRLDELVTLSAGQTMNSTANGGLLSLSEAGFGSFVYFCRDVPSYTWCNLFYKQASSVYLMIKIPYAEYIHHCSY